MSKAFTKEDDDAPVARVRPRGIPIPELNFITASGLASARAELAELGRSGGDPDRVAELAAHLATAQVAEPTDREVVALGATVVVQRGDTRATYRIVGAIESDPKRGWVFWQSPLAQALHGLRAGDTAVLPNGDEVELVSIAY